VNTIGLVFGGGGVVLILGGLLHSVVRLGRILQMVEDLDDRVKKCEDLPVRVAVLEALAGLIPGGSGRVR